MSFFGSDSTAKTTSTQIGASDNAVLASSGGANFFGGGKKSKLQAYLPYALAAAVLIAIYFWYRRGK